MTFAQELAPTPQTTGQPGITIEEVIVTGSNIPTSEEVGPNPVDTYRTEDIEKLGARNATDLLTKLPQEMGSTVNQNIGWRGWQRHTKPAWFAAQRNLGSGGWKTRRTECKRSWR
jgi:hypothetical protein